MFKCQNCTEGFQTEDPVVFQAHVEQCAGKRTANRPDLFQKSLVTPKAMDATDPPTPSSDAKAQGRFSFGKKMENEKRDDARAAWDNQHLDTKLMNKPDEKKPQARLDVQKTPKAEGEGPPKKFLRMTPPDEKPMSNDDQSPRVAEKTVQVEPQPIEEAKVESSEEAEVESEGGEVESEGAEVESEGAEVESEVESEEAKVESEETEVGEETKVGEENEDEAKEDAEQANDDEAQDDEAEQEETKEEAKEQDINDEEPAIATAAEWKQWLTTTSLSFASDDKKQQCVECLLASYANCANPIEAFKQDVMNALNATQFIKTKLGVDESIADALANAVAISGQSTQS